MSLEVELIFAAAILACLQSFVLPDAQGDALFSLRSSLNASNSQLSNWYPNQVNPCTWSNVQCDPNNNVITVSLSNMGFSGTLSSKIGVLKTLLTLSLQGNGITGEIPKEIGNLTSLTMLDLENNHLTGEIPSSLGNLEKLQFLFLNQNNLTGEIPETLSSLRNLVALQLASNGLTGQIPQHLFQVPKYKYGKFFFFSPLMTFAPSLMICAPGLSSGSFTGNHLNCSMNFARPCDSASGGSLRKSKTGIIFGIVGALLGLLLLGGLFLLLWKAKHKGYKREIFVDVAGKEVMPSINSLGVRSLAPMQRQKQLLGLPLRSIVVTVLHWLDETSFLSQSGHRATQSGLREVDRQIAFGQLKRFAWRELQLATENFSEKNVLGQGGFGKVYKGVLADNTKVAVKRLTDYESPGGDAAFQREVEMISVAVHRNLLRLIGFCTTPTERLLVYPFMQNLSVAYCLREFKPGEAVLDWPTRKRVALGTARGLEYLHEHCNPKIIHRDVKAANVMLDEDFEAVVGDFGLAKLVDVRKTNVTTQVRGTMGHIAPEYLSTGKSSERTDVFGYGIMLLELVTGQRAIDFSRLEEEDDVLLLDHVKKVQREKILDAIVDCNLNDNFNIEEVEMMIQVALLCTQASPEDRPAMSDVVRMLEGEGLAERWEEWQHVEVTRRQEYERLQRRFDWGEDSIYNQVKKVQREKRLDAIVDCNLNDNFNIEEVEMMIQVALLCTQASPEDRPAMSDVVRMLEGEGLAERWEEWQHVEVTRRQEYERLQRRFDWGEDSIYNQVAVELSGGR
ncbi:unnamed protein product [Ilex paraguariensis]|uniref:non-specific serine/threonine protein kinase n=1 Tax=Ilex paraguariensis TaxID=185542 RepID=A0ABC8UGL3_9AQUA